MARNGLLIDYEFCTGCHTCEVACQMENHLPPTQWGIKALEVGPWKIGDKWQYAFVPVPTEQCNLCAPRVAKGHEPTCVKHCPANVMKYGPVDELVKDLDGKPRQVIFAPK